MNHVTRLFETRNDLQEVLAKLEMAGIAEYQISILASDDTRNRDFSIENTTKIEEGATTGATLGGLAGATIAALASASAIAIPGMNVVISGYLISALAGLGAGAATGGLLGALIGAGFSEYEAKIYEDKLKKGNILIAVKPVDHVQKRRIEQIFDELNKSQETNNDLSQKDYKKQSRS